MSTASSHMSALSPADAVVALADLARERLRSPQSAPPVERIEVPVTAISPASWLAAQAPGERLFWADRDRARLVAGKGMADSVAHLERPDPGSLIAHVHGRLFGSDAKSRYYGGMRFDSLRHPAPHWSLFAALRFVLPRFELSVDEQGTALAVNLCLPDDFERESEIIGQLEALVFRPNTGLTELPELVSRRDNPDRDLWIARVEQAIESIRAGRMDKVVLARETVLEADRAVDPAALTARLHETVRDCFTFCFEPARGCAFLGASPERLYRRDGRIIRSEALAGTRPRGSTPEDDARLGEKLLTSRKEAREHAFVAEAIHRTLAAQCRALRGDRAPSLVKLERVQHLATRFEGELNDGIDDAQLLGGLHPTPAVGGVPTEEARACIRELETFDRGWYAGPVGWIGAEGAEFAVGLRSALVGGNTLRVYSGAGIVDGSHPDREWDEIENKIGGFLKLLAGQ